MFRSAARKVVDHDPARVLFEAAVRFLADHRLGYDPARYAFAWRVVSDPEGPLARAVAALTEGGIRLTEDDLKALGERSGDDAGALERAAALVAQTRAQMDSFVGLMDRMREETTDFGRDLAASVDALDATHAPTIVSLTVSMLSRVQAAEDKLADATVEAAGLRAELAVARDDARADPLTGLPNRRAMIEAYAAAAAEGRPHCLAIADIDHFKRINDRFGHAVGDRVLTAIARTLADSCDEALVARYGGEEFALLFPHGDLAAAAAALERARAEVAGRRYRLRDADTLLGTITFSGGAIVVAPGEALEDAFARSDVLLYRAKENGRNRIEF